MEPRDRRRKTARARQVESEEKVEGRDDAKSSEPDADEIEKGEQGKTAREERGEVTRAFVLTFVRYAWAAPASAVGLILSVLAFACGAKPRVVDRVLEVGGGRLRQRIALLPQRLRFDAITFGHVIIGVDDAALARTRRHEHVHVRQYERWGVLFFPLYLGSSAVQAVRGRDPYRNNCFEREAYAKAGPKEDV
jgi:hypothetical protein